MSRNDAQPRLGGHTVHSPDHLGNKIYKMHGEIRWSQMGRVTLHLKFPSREHLCGPLSQHSSGLKYKTRSQHSTVYNPPDTWVDNHLLAQPGYNNALHRCQYYHYISIIMVGLVVGLSSWCSVLSFNFNIEQYKLQSSTMSMYVLHKTFRSLLRIFFTQ